MSKHSTVKSIVSDQKSIMILRLYTNNLFLSKINLEQWSILPFQCTLGINHDCAKQPKPEMEPKYLTKTGVPLNSNIQRIKNMKKKDKKQEKQIVKSTKIMNVYWFW